MNIKEKKLLLTTNMFYMNKINATFNQPNDYKAYSLIITLLMNSKS